MTTNYNRKHSDMLPRKHTLTSLMSRNSSTMAPVFRSSLSRGSSCAGAASAPLGVDAPLSRLRLDSRECVREPGPRTCSDGGADPRPLDGGAAPPESWRATASALARSRSFDGRGAMCAPRACAPPPRGLSRESLRRDGMTVGGAIMGRPMALVLATRFMESPLGSSRLSSW